MTTAPVAPADVFAALWPDVKRYVGRLASQYARRSRVDRDDLFQAGTLAVWKAAEKGTLGRHPTPLALVDVAARRAMFEAMNRERKHYRASAADPDDFTRMASREKRPDELAGFGFGDLLELADPRDRGLLDERFRAGVECDQIARRAGVTRQAISARTDQALARIRQRIDPANLLA